MATIQNIPGNEAPATSRAKINSNFTAVNDEVVAATSAVAGKEDSGTAAAAVAAHVAAGDPHAQYALESDVTTALAAKVDAAYPTFTGPVTTSGAVINAGTAMTGEVINVALRNNLYSATANVTWTHSATPAVGQEYGVTVTTDGTARTIGLPGTCKSANAGGDVTAVTFPASSTTEIRIKRTASEYLITGDPVSKETVKAGLAITSSDLADFNSATRAQVEAMLIQSTNITLTPSGSGASRQIAVASSGGGGGGGVTFSIDDGDATADPATIGSFDDGDATTP